MKNNIKIFCKDIENHFSKYKIFYMSILITLLVIFIWCKWGNKLLQKMINKKHNVSKNNLNLNSENKYYNQQIVNEINNILLKIN